MITYELISPHGQTMQQGGLYVVATPIGNLEDLSYRAARVLGAADVIAAEDTRRARVLLDHYGVAGTVVSLHEHNEEARTPELLERVRAGGTVALISDAGTPLISDPGFRLVQAAAEAGLSVIPVPGASALTAALSVAGLPTDRFAFEGFLPSKASARRKRVAALQGEPRTLVFFESGQRLSASLRDLCESFGAERKAVLCRELTKRFENVLRSNLQELSEDVKRDSDHLRGEMVLLVEGAPPRNRQLEAVELGRALLEFLSVSQAARAAARLTGVPRRDIYAALEAVSDASGTGA